MFSSTPFAFSAAVLAACASLVSAGAGPILNTPGALIACQPVQLTWSGGVGPYYISAIPGNEPSGKPLEQIGTFTSQSTSWTVDLKAGTFVTLEITDSTGAINWASALTVQAGSCSAKVKSKAPKAANKVLGTTSVIAAGDTATATATGSAKAHKTSSGAHSAAASKAKSAAAAASGSAASGSANGTTAATKGVASAASSGASRLSAGESSVTGKAAATSAANSSAAAATSATVSGAGGVVRPAGVAGVVGLVGVALFCLV